jgi:hypothetical protein
VYEKDNMIADYRGFTIDDIAPGQLALAFPAVQNESAEEHVPSDECAVCLGEHDYDIHAATLSVRQWFREQVTISFAGCQ